jgi:anti-anti-sigma factor
MGRHDPPLSVGCRWDGRRVTVIVCGEVDFATASLLARQLETVAGQEPEHLTIDLGQTSFLDAAGLRVIIQARQALPPSCPVMLRSPVRHVRMALEVSGLSVLCPIEEPGQPDQTPRRDIHGPSLDAGPRLPGAVIIVRFSLAARPP